MSFTQEPLGIRRRSFSLLFRYSCQHSHFPALHGWLPPPLRRVGNAPLPLSRAESVASAPCLSPVTLSAPDHLTSELLRTLLMVAASKPTSWLSLQSDIVSHLAWN